MTFTQAIATCFRRYVTFSGRSARPEFWWFLLFVVAVSAILSLVDAAIFGRNPQTGEFPAILSGAFSIATFLPLLAAGWRRMHDTGRPGWYLLLPALLSFAFLIFAFLGVFAFTAAETRMDDPNVLVGPAALIGGLGVAILATVQIALSILMIWWLTRPSVDGPNEYGPKPVAIAAQNLSA